jgi:hypothetical protein
MDNPLPHQKAGAASTAVMLVAAYKEVGELEAPRSCMLPKLVDASAHRPGKGALRGSPMAMMCIVVGDGGRQWLRATISSLDTPAKARKGGQVEGSPSMLCVHRR